MENQEPRNEEFVTAHDYEMAEFSQSACNLSGIVHSLDKIVTKLWNEARRDGHGTDWVNQHPIVRLYAEQISHLSSSRDYYEASKICREKAHAEHGSAAQA